MNNIRILTISAMVLFIRICQIQVIRVTDQKFIANNNSRSKTEKLT